MRNGSTPWVAATILTGIVLLASMGVNIYFKGQVDSLQDFRAEFREVTSALGATSNANTVKLADHEARIKSLERTAPN